MVVHELSIIREGVINASGADFWYEGQLTRELLRLKVALIEARHGDSSEWSAKVTQRLDIVYSRLNNLPKPGSSEWHTQGIAEFPQLSAIRSEIEAIDRLGPLLGADPAEYVDKAIPHVDASLSLAADLGIRVIQVQNDLIGATQHRFSDFQRTLLLYGAGTGFVILGLAYLMFSHMRAAKLLRTVNDNLVRSTVELANARDEAISANRAKGNFLANVSHELRTPLNAIIGFGQMLEMGISGPLGEKQLGYVRDINRAAEHLLNLIGEILDLSRVEAGKYLLREAPVDLGHIANEAVRTIREKIMQARLAVAVEVAPSVPMVHGDPVKLRQIVDNLLSNAVKFTKVGGKVRIGIDQLADGRVRLAVADTGIGIAATEIPRIFRAFEQIDSQLAREHDGSGLGLPLVKALVELHGGTVELTSEPDLGTTVTVLLPAERAIPVQQRLIA